MTKIYFIRHAQSTQEGTVNYRLWVNRTVSEEGRKQALSLAKSLKPHHISAIYTSAFPRAVQTADILKEYLCVPTYCYPELGERILSTNRASKNLEKWWRLSIQDWNYAPPYKGESINSAVSRFRKVVDEKILGKFSSKNMAVISHERILRFYFQKIFDPVDIRRIDFTNELLNCNCTIVEFIKSGNKLIEFNKKIWG